jgi:hypothetical protein
MARRVLRESGRPLNTDVRRAFDARFSFDFSSVRIHDGRVAAESARLLRAAAWTAGRHVVFGSGRYAPETPAGERLLAHELTHVIQQRAASGVDPVAVAACDSPEELAAERSAQGMTRGSIEEGRLMGFIHRQLEEEETQGAPIVTDETGLYGPDNGFDEEEEVRGEAGLPMVATAIQRQDADIPPPPPAYPHFTQLPFGPIFDEMQSADGLTCEDRRERGFFIHWNVRTKVASAGEWQMGEPAPEDCSKPASIELGSLPVDRPPMLVAGWFHTHPPMRQGCTQLAVGPSSKDQQTSRTLKMPGVVIDFSSPGPNRSCKDKTRGLFFFGPSRRET